MDKKYLCDCGEIATYLYLPGYSNGGNSFSCYSCVPKGCSCNERTMSEKPVGIEGVDWKMSEGNPSHWCNIDVNGNPYPCSEYDCDDDGFYTIEFIEWIEDFCEKSGHKIIDNRHPDWDHTELGYGWDEYLVNKIENELDSELTPT